ncbi:MAG: PQQ-binding-like beta-propeller repeat protein, partial [Candidatus Aenigmatarchaeota archaeon]
MASMVFVSGCVRQPGQNPNGTAAGPEGGQPGGSQAGNGMEGFRTPPFDATKPLQGPPMPGENKTLMLGDIEIKYYSVAASYPMFSLGADFFMHVLNTGASAETFSITQASKPASWNLHFFAFHPESMTLQPGEERALHYFSSNDAEGQFDMDFDMWQDSGNLDKVTARVKFYSGSQEESKIAYDAMLYGYVLDKPAGLPVAGVDVQAFSFSGRDSFNERTDSEGRYALPIVSEEAVNAFLGGQETSYASLANFVVVDADGYEYSYTGGVSAKRGEKLRLDIYLEPEKPAQKYSLDWEQKVSDYYGFFWVVVDDGWTRVVASQAKHPPQLDKPTNFYLFDAETGAQLWEYPTGNECWGIDISRDGSLVAAGCSDDRAYVVNAADGSLKWSYDGGGMNREVELSHDGQWLVTGPAKATDGTYDFALFKASDGSMSRGFGGRDMWLRNSRFNADDSKFVVGLGGGDTAMYDTASGDLVWENYIGEFAMFLAIDSDGNTYAAGKGRTLFSFDPAGKPRWSFRIPDHTAGTGAISSDGSRVAIGTVGGWVYYIDGSTGDVLWRARVPT